MQLNDFIDAIESIAPPRYAESWDNVGLLAGDPRQPLSKLLLTIDFTPAVAQEALRLRCDAVLSYHPPIFQGLKRIPPTSPLHIALRHGIAIYSPHTAWDAAPGGANDHLASLLDLKELRPMKPVETRATFYKLVTFVPDNDLDKVADALFHAGAGKLGNYSRCSFRSPGVGTFFGEEGSSPALGQPHHFETVDEIRLETLVPASRLEPVLAALRESHPYEEPAFDLLQLASPPDAIGVGRIGVLDRPVAPAELASRLKKGLKISSLLTAGPARKSIKTVALCAGAGGELLDLAIKQKADAYVTGELRHHDALMAASAGISVFCTLHSNSERSSLKPLADRIKQKLPKLKLVLSKVDRDPFMIA